MNVLRIPFAALVAVVVLTTAAAALAQQPPMSNRPFRGVFGGGMSDTEQSLTVTGSFGTGYDSDVYAAVRGDSGVDGSLRPRVGSSVAFWSGSASYSLSREKVSLGASAATTSYAYHDDGTQVISSHSGSANQSYRVSSRTRLNASEHVSFEPFQLGRLFPALDPSFGAPDVPSPDRLAASDAYLTWGADVGLSHQISRRVSASGGYSAYSSEWSAASRQTLHYGRAGISVGIGRGLNARAGYGYRQGRYGEGPDPRLVRNHTIDAGVDFSRTLSFSRRTTFSFSTGSTAIRDRSQTHFALTGNAQLNRELGRSWRASVGYSRDVRFIEQFQEVLLSDGINASVRGLINRRQSFYANVGVSIGDVGFTAGQNRAFATYASVGVVTAVNRFMGIGTDYNYYVHSFGADVVLPQGVLREVDRHSVRAYVSLWAPLFARMRSQNASR